MPGFPTIGSGSGSRRERPVSLTKPYLQGLGGPEVGELAQFAHDFRRHEAQPGRSPRVAADYDDHAAAHVLHPAIPSQVFGKHRAELARPGFLVPDVP